MVRTILKTFGKVLFKIGLAAGTERFISKIAFDLMYWLAGLSTNPLAVTRVQDLEQIYRGKEIAHAPNTFNRNS